MSCEYEFRCLNRDKCYRCFGEKLLKLKEDKFKRKASRNTYDKVKASSDDSWKALEEEVANKLNRVPNIKEARRSRRSGALDFEKGDVVDTILHPECKERAGRELKSGDKSFTILKSWLEKSKDECKDNSKFMCLPFRYKNDEAIYVVMDFEDLAELVTTMKSHIQDNEIKEKEIEILKKKILELSK